MVSCQWWHGIANGLVAIKIKPWLSSQLIGLIYSGASQVPKESSLVQINVELDFDPLLCLLILTSVERVSKAS